MFWKTIVGNKRGGSNLPCLWNLTDINNSHIIHSGLRDSIPHYIWSIPFQHTPFWNFAHPLVKPLLYCYLETNQKGCFHTTNSFSNQNYWTWILNSEKFRHPSFDWIAPIFIKKLCYSIFLLSFGEIIPPWMRGVPTLLFQWTCQCHVAKLFKIKTYDCFFSHV